MKRTGSQPEGAAVGSSITDDRISVPVGGSGDGGTDVAVSGLDVEVGGSGVGEGKIVSELTLSVA